MNARLHSVDGQDPCLLKSEPDVRADQAWMLMALNKGRVIEQEVVIADTLAQVRLGITKLGWIPLVIMNEATLEQQIIESEAQPAVSVRDRLGRPGTKRFGLIFQDHAERVVWVMAPDSQRAIKAARRTGEDEALLGVVAVEDFISTRDELRRMRQRRGRGAAFDGRFLDDVWARDRALMADRLPGGQAQLDEELRAIHEMCAQGAADWQASDSQA